MIQRFEDRVIWGVYGRFSRTITRDYAVFFSRVRLMAWYGIKLYLMCIDCNLAGTKNVAKELKKICAGPVKARDKTWFAQLSDKGMCCVVLFFFFFQ